MVATYSPYIVNYLNVLISGNNRLDSVAEPIPSTSHEQTVCLPAEDLAVYRVYDGEVQNLMLEDSMTHERWVNSEDLSEAMHDIQNRLNL